MKDKEIKTYINKGRRHYRLKLSIEDCPFDDPEKGRAWRAGYCAAMENVSGVNAPLAAFLMGISSKNQHGLSQNNP